MFIESWYWSLPDSYFPCMKEETRARGKWEICRTARVSPLGPPSLLFCRMKGKGKTWKRMDLKRMTLPLSLEQNPRIQPGPHHSSHEFCFTGQGAHHQWPKQMTGGPAPLFGWHRPLNLHINWGVACTDTAGASSPWWVRLEVRFNELRIKLIPAKQIFVYQLSIMWILFTNFLVTIISTSIISVSLIPHQQSHKFQELVINCE